MKVALTLFGALFISVSAMAQQPSQYSLYMLNKVQQNPAYAGLDNSLVATGVFRRQWTGLEGSPTTQALNVHLPIYYLNSGFGLKFENDVLGASQQLSITGVYSYQVLMDNGVLSFGVEGGIVQRSLDGELLRTPEGVYQDDAFDHNDQILPFGLETAVATTFGAGIYYQTEQFEIGVAAQNITEAEAAFSTLNLQLVRYYTLMASYSFDISRSFSLQPSVLVRSDINQTQVEASVLTTYNENIFGGVGFRGYNSETIDAVSFIAGFKLSENLSLGYAYDYTLSDLNVVSTGSHEIVVSYNLNRIFGKGQPPRIIYNPRSL
ncbi:MAG: type IX secretion system membrane protein PorP/SprF [Bacteroidota bacterium]